MLHVLHLISLNKYVVTLIINQGNSCLTYFMIVSLFVGFLENCFSYRIKIIIPLLEKILLLVRCCDNIYNGRGVKFVVSSIIRCYLGPQGCRIRSATLGIISRSRSFSLFVLFHLI